MPHNTFYHPHPLERGSEISLHPDESKHLSVMRLREGDRCFLLNGSGDKADGKILSIHGKKVSILIDSVKTFTPPLPAFHLIVAIMKIPKLEWVIEKSCELGVSSLTIFPGDFSECKEISFNKKERLNLIQIAALKQSGNPFLPKISFLSGKDEIEWSRGAIYYGSIEESAQPLGFQREEFSFIVGPEKGFSKEEIAFFHKYHIKGRKIASHILRAETAAVAICSIADYFRLSSPA